MQKISDVFASKGEQKKPPAYQWQDMALKIIEELGVPNFKRNSVFKIAKEYSKNDIESALVDTKELAKGGEKWKYFFKVISQYKKQ